MEPHSPSSAPSVLLKPRQTRLNQLGDVITPAILVGFFVVGLIVMLFVEKPSSRGDWWAAGTLIGVFGLVALVLAIGTGVFFLALFNPKVQLRVSSDRVPTGGTLDVAWEIRSRAHVIQELHLYLEGVQEVENKRGGRNEFESFATIDICRTEGRSRIKAGTTSITIPPDAKPSSTEAITALTGACTRWARSTAGRTCATNLRSRFCPPPNKQIRGGIHPLRRNSVPPFPNAAGCCVYQPSRNAFDRDSGQC